MELIHLNQIDFNELRFEKIDCIIATCGYQPRCFYLAEKLHTKVPNKYLLTIEEKDNHQNRLNHKEIFKDFGFKNYSATINESKGIEDLLFEICNISTRQLNLIIDYSCMPKKWYALIIDSITSNSFRASRINLFLSYTPKKFERIPNKNSIDYIGPILFNRDNLKDKKPVSMIAALDNNHDSIMEAISIVKPQKLFAFIPRCAHDPDYTRLVTENNKALLDRLDSNSIVNYDADRPEELNTLLTSYCLDQRISSEVMIVPQGPKTFSLMSLLVSVRYPDVKLWEIILGDPKANIEHGFPAANPVVIKVSFVNDDEESDE
jgi:hypothetical protein